MQRREFLQLAGATLAAGFSTPKRGANRRVILPYAPGGATMRPVAHGPRLSQAFGQQFVIENRAELAARSAPGGPVVRRPRSSDPNAPLSVVPTPRKTAMSCQASIRSGASAMSSAALSFTLGLSTRSMS
jgi:hypothetical protein